MKYVQGRKLFCSATNAATATGSDSNNKPKAKWVFYFFTFLALPVSCCYWM